MKKVTRGRAFFLFTTLIIVATAIHAAEYVEISTELNSTWRSGARISHQSIIAICVVGTNDWSISGNFTRNTKNDYWLFDTNVIERRTITSSMYLQQAKDLYLEKIMRQKPHAGLAFSYPQAGQVFTIIHDSPHGQLAGEAMANIVWLAFCSGPYLQHDGREIPMPVGPSSKASGYSDKTVVFKDLLGLPESVKLFAPDGQLVCEYEVLQRTNFLGRTFPLNFRLMRSLRTGRGQAQSIVSTTEVLGKVTSIKIGRPRELPSEARKKLER
jgi:hypothetical protein